MKNSSEGLNNYKGIVKKGNGIFTPICAHVPSQYHGVSWDREQRLINLSIQ